MATDFNGNVVFENNVFDQSLNTDDNVEFAGLTIDGDAKFTNIDVTDMATVSTLVTTTELEVEDPIILMGKGAVDDSKNLGFIAEYKDGVSKWDGLVRDKTDKKFHLFKDATTKPTPSSVISSLTKSDLSLGNITSNGDVNLNKGTAQPIVDFNVNEFVTDLGSIRFNRNNIKRFELYVQNVPEQFLIRDEAGINRFIVSNVTSKLVSPDNSNNIELYDGFSNFDKEIRANTSLKVGDNTSPDSKAVLDCVSTTKGILIPRMTTAQRDAITSVPTGLIIYNITKNDIEHYNGTVWKTMGNPFDQSLNVADSPQFQNVQAETFTVWDSSVSLLQLQRGAMASTSNQMLWASQERDAWFLQQLGGDEHLRLFNNELKEDCIKFNWDTDDVSIAKSLSVGTTNEPDSKAVLDCVSTTKGILIPRLSTVERNNITSPPTGLIIYNTTTNDIEYYNGTSWVGTVSGNPFNQSLNVEDNAQFNQLTIDNASNSDLIYKKGGVKSWTVRSSSGGEYELLDASDVQKFKLTSSGNAVFNGSLTCNNSNMSLLGSANASFTIRRGVTNQVANISFTTSGGGLDALQILQPVNSADVVIENNTQSQEIARFNATDYNLELTTKGATNAPTKQLTLKNDVNGTPAVGCGSSVNFNQEVQVGVYKDIAKVESLLQSVGAGTEDSAIRMYIMDNGSLQERFRLAPAGLILTGGAYVDVQDVRCNKVDRQTAGTLSIGDITANKIEISKSGVQTEVKGDTSINTSLHVGSSAVSNSKAVLECTSTTKGFLPPRMTSGQRDSINSPPTGLLIYNTTTNKLNYYNAGWLEIGNGGTGDVSGPASSTADAVAVYNGTTGKIIKDSKTNVNSDGEMRTMTGFFAGGLRRCNSLWTQTAQVEIKNTTVETSMIGAGVGFTSIPANFFKAGSSLRFNIRGTVDENTSNPSVRMRIKLGSVVLFDINRTVSATNRLWNIDCEVVCRSIGASGSFICLGTWNYYNGILYWEKSCISATVDTTTSNAIAVTCQWDSANPNNYVRCETLEIDLVR